VLLTGAARGIGAETARRLAGRGARVALVDIDAEAVERTAAGVTGSVWFCADVTDPEAIRTSVQGTVEALGGVDVAIANAGIASRGSIRSMDPAQSRRIIEVNLVGALNTLHAVLPHVIARRGYLLAVSSLAALAHVPGLGPYSASKAGLEAMCDALRSELRHRGVDVGVAYLSWIDTEMLGGGERTAGRHEPGSGLPAPFHRVHRLSDAAEAIVSGIERRDARIAHPRWLTALLPLRGLLQPAVDREMRRRLVRLHAQRSGEAGR
jgi:NAD(P)-dependent dehydrogenase (short-subunit alcohol dehydrogenase family)